MNRRFLRWILDRAHEAEAFEKRQFKFNSFENRNKTIRWNSLICAIGFGFISLVCLQSSNVPNLLAGVGIAGLGLCLWIFWYHLHILHHMRHRGKKKEALRVMRRMLNVVPGVICALFLFSFLALVPALFSPIFEPEFGHEPNSSLIIAVIISLFAPILLPLLGTLLWVYAAISPFHADYCSGKKK